MNYELITIRTILNEGEGTSGLSFVEGIHDIPFDIKSMYFAYENEQEMLKGFQPEKKSWNLLFCPNGRIDVKIDDSKENITVSLDNPSKGLILHPDIWREIEWISQGSVLCIASSEYCGTIQYNKNYNDYLKYAEAEKLKSI